MANTPDFVDHLLELMRAGGRAVDARRMFGGHGLYADGLFFGIVADDVVYLRADDDNRAEFDAHDAPPFEYRKKDGVGRAMGYRRPPDEALESRDAMAPWLRSALGAALRAAARRGTRGRKRPKRPAKAGSAKRAR